MTTNPDEPPVAPDAAAIVIERRVEWVDTDASGRYHYTAAFRLFEAAESALLGRLGLLSEMQPGLPRVHVEADFRRPLFAHDRVEVHARVAAVGRSSLSFAFEIVRSSERCVEGRIITARLSGPGGETAPWSEEERTLLLTAGRQRGERLIDADP